MSMAGNGLVKLGEEYGELTAIVCKKLAYFKTDEHPDDAGSMKIRLEDEIADVIGASALVIENFDLNSARISARAETKHKLFKKWCADDSNSTDGFGSEIEEYNKVSIEIERPIAWMRADGMKSMTDDEKQGWIESGHPDISADYTIPLGKI